MALDGRERSRWQYLGRKFWNSFDASSTSKLTRAMDLGAKNCKMWDGETLVEIDFENMIRLPGRQPLRLAPMSAPSAHTLKEKSQSDAELRQVGKARRTNSSPQRRRSPKKWAKGRQHSRSNSPERAKLTEQPDGFRALVHNAFLEMGQPRFSFKSEMTQEEEMQGFDWQRRLDACEDATDKTMCIAHIYKDLMQNLLKPVLPVKGTPAQTMAALSLALHMSGALRCPEDCSMWQLSQRVAHGLVQRVGTSSQSRPQTGSQTNCGAVPLAVVDLVRSKSLSSLERSSSAVGSSGTMRLQPVVRPGCVTAITFRLPDDAASRNQSLKVTKAWNEWSGLARARSRAPMLHLPKVNGSYKWTILNDPESRLKRLGGLCSTLWQVFRHDDIINIPGRVILFSADRQKKRCLPEAKIVVARTEPDLGPLDIGILNVMHGRRVGVVLICSDDDIGGKLFADSCAGSMSGQEEEACMRSDLSACLRQSAALAEKMQLQSSCCKQLYIPELGATVCTDLQIYREGQEGAFVPYTVPVVLPAAICVQLRNLNPHQDPTAEKRIELQSFDQGRYALQVKAKFAMALVAADQLGLKALVVSDIGCQKLCNDAEMLGAMLAQALEESTCASNPELVLSGSRGFLSAVKKGINREHKSSWSSLQVRK